MAPLLNVLRIAPEVFLNAKKRDSASFFEDEGLTAFLNLEWDIEVEKNLVLEFIENYHRKNRKVTMSTGDIAINDDLMREVFHLPEGPYKMPRRMRKKVISPYFPDTSASSFVPRGGRGPENGFLHDKCNDEVWQDRFFFLHLVFSIKTKKRAIIPYFFVEFLQAEGKRCDWFDAFRWFFDAEIARIKRAKGAKTSTAIGAHISLLLAHVQKKKEQPERPKPKRAKRGQSALTETGRESQDPNSASNKKKRKREDNHVVEVGTHRGEVKKSQIIPKSLSVGNVEEQIFRHYDTERQGISELLHLMTGLRNEVELWKSGPGNVVTVLRNENDYLKNEVEMWKSEYGNRITELRRENSSLKNDVEKWKNEVEVWKTRCGKVEQCREDLEAKVTAFWASTKLGAAEDNFKFTRPLPDDPSSGFATPPLSKNTKAPKLLKKEIKHD